MTTTNNSDRPQDNVTACTKKQYLVSFQDLPISCPMPDMSLWNAHPRVYLPIEETGQATCPYCGAEFFLTDSCKLDIDL